MVVLLKQESVAQVISPSYISCDLTRTDPGICEGGARKTMPS